MSDPRKKNMPYFGVSGFMTAKEVFDVLNMLPDNPTRRLMVGVLMSEKTLSGATNKWPGRYPQPGAIKSLFFPDLRVLNLVHYHSETVGRLAEDLKKITALSGPNLHGFQLNIPWPPMAQLARYRGLHPKTYFVLQLGKKALEETFTPADLREKVRSYLPLIDAVLLDASGGRGLALDPGKSVEFLRELRQLSGLGLGLAGGLGPDTIHHFTDLLPEFPSLSCDAESCLRTGTEADELELQKVWIYLNSLFD